MDINIKMKINKWWNVLWKGGVVVLVIFSFVVVLRMIYITKNTPEQVAKIHSTKLTLDDVFGKNLPTDPGAEADKTVAGIDANTNGIRDDVELAIFKEYPDSAKTRAVLLQYALALQMEVIQPIVNTETVTEVVREQSRAYLCVGKILSRNDIEKYIQDGDSLRSFVEIRQFDTEERKKAQLDFLKKVSSHESLDRYCDIDYSTLSN